MDQLSDIIIYPPEIFLNSISHFTSEAKPTVIVFL